MGATLYTAGAAVHWDNNMAGEMQALWTRGTGQVVIRAAGPRGTHYINVGDAIGVTYMNIIQSPVPYANGGSLPFQVTSDPGVGTAFRHIPSCGSTNYDFTHNFIDGWIRPCNQRQS